MAQLVSLSLTNLSKLIMPELKKQRSCLAVISFKNGAFAAGVPVQPVSIKYPSRDTFDNSWVTVRLLACTRKHGHLMKLKMGI